jgi:transcriptional regulator with XRE-family HTH domain
MTDLAEKSGIPMSTLSRFESEKNKHRPSHENVQALARAFEIDPEDVLRFIGYPRRRLANGAARDQEWDRLRDLIESDPRAKRMIDLYDHATEEDKDLGVELLEVYFKKRPRRPPPKQ